MKNVIFAIGVVLSLTVINRSTAQCCGDLPQFSLGLSAQHMVLGIDVNELSQRETSINGQLFMAELDSRYGIVSLNLRGGIAPSDIVQEGEIEISNFFSTQGVVSLNILPWTSDFNVSIGGGIHYDGGRVNNLLTGHKATVRTMALVAQGGFDITISELFLLSADVGFGQYVNDGSIDLLDQGDVNDRKLFGSITFSYMFP